jgi:dTDP-4-amino-4,6-dideoxygalactose transaminase
MMQFIDLPAQLARIRPAIDAAIQRVLDHGIFIMGPEVAELEQQLASFCGVKHAITCANGTDALILGLMAKQVGPGDAIFVPSFTFAATTEAVVWLGATPVFIDVRQDTYNIDIASLEAGIAQAETLGLKPKGVIPVDLFGQPADYDALQALAAQHGLWILADAAQSFGASYKGRRVGSLGDIATTSFFPAKPLGCYGDGGAIFTHDDAVAAMIRSLRVHGQGVDKYDNVYVGMNSRLDTLQAAILLEKLKIFPDELVARQKTAASYSQALAELVIVPHVLEATTSAWAQYTVCLPEQVNRAELIVHLKEAAVPSMVYYVKPLHKQRAYQQYPTATGQELPVSESLAKRVLSLPMSGYFKSIQYVTTTMQGALIK